MKYLLLILTLATLNGCATYSNPELILASDDVSKPDPTKPYDWGLAERRYTKD